MNTRFTSLGLPIAAALAAPLAIAPAAAPAQVVAPAPTQMLQVATGRGRMITLSHPITDVFVAADSIADVQVRSPTQIYIFGKAPGETTISATSRGGAVVFAATIRVGNNYDSLQQMLGLAMPEAHIVATPMNGLVLLTGTVAAPQDAAEAERLVQAFVGEGTRVLSRLRTATPLQVNLQVRFAEVSRNFVRNIGVNLATADSSGGFQFGVGQGRAAGAQFAPDGPLGVGVTAGRTGTSVVSTLAGSTTLGLAGHLLGLDVLGAIDLGERLGQVSTLANPNLTALSGETGTFLAGGEIPIPVSQGLGAVSVEYKQYGISLAYTPTVLSDGRISLRVRPEVSQLSSAGAVTINGTTIPALTTRRAETTVELGSGQSFMIAGLLSNSHDNSITRAPGLGQLPVLGALFRSNNFQRNETELVIIITPYLVRPVDASQIALPTDGELAPTTASQVLLGTLSSGRSGVGRPVPQVAPPADANPAFGTAQPAATVTPPLGTPPTVTDTRRDERRQSRHSGHGADAATMPGFSN